MKNPAPLPFDWFSEHEVASYHTAQCGQGSQCDAGTTADLAPVDDGTWRDLLVPDYLRLIAGTVGLWGRQMLYHRLRCGYATPKFVAPLVAALNPARDPNRDPDPDALCATPALNPETTDLLAATLATRAQLRAQSVDITRTLFHGDAIALPRWTRHISWAPVVPLLAVLLPFLNVVPALHMGWLTPWLIGLYLVFNGWTQITLHRVLARWTNQRDGVVAMLEAARALGRGGLNPQAARHAVLEPLHALLPEVNLLLAHLSPTWVERTPMVTEYATLFALLPYAELGPRSARLQAHLPALCRVYEALASCEAQLGLLEHLQDQSVVCGVHWVQPIHSPAQLELQGFINPLVQHPEPLSLCLACGPSTPPGHGGGAFITGQNGVGKSTLLRAIGLNMLAARAFGFCYAHTALLPNVPVYSSIQIEDSLRTADSLYMAEMRRAEALVKVAQAGTGGLFLIDEIFKGTNHHESIVAAAAVLQHVAQHGLVLVSSHNLGLATLLPQLRPLRLVRASATSSALCLQDGVLVQTNGIAMLDQYDFPQSVRDTAANLHERLAVTLIAATH